MKKEYRALYLLAFLKFILPFILQSNFYEPHRDEFLYIAEGSHLAWGFIEVPPMISLFAALIKLLGNDFFWIKFWPALFGSFTFLIVGKMILSLGGRSFALFLGFLPFIFGAYLRVHFLFQPNFLEIFFWTLMAYSIFRFIQSGHNHWLYVFGIAVGFGMLSKYSVLFFVFSLLMGLLLTKHRKIFLNRHLYISGLLAFLIFLPNLWWQFDHHFPVFVHMKELQRTQLRYINPLDFLTDQILMNLPCVFIWIAGLYFVIFKQAGKYRVFSLAFLWVMIVLIYFQGKNYYSLGVYPVLFAFGAYQLERFVAQHSNRWKYAFIVIPFVLGIPLIPLLLPVASPKRLADYYEKTHLEKTGLLKWEDLKNHPLPQDFADMLGWKEIAEKTARAYSTLSAEEKRNTIIFADNYGQVGAINYYRSDYDLPVAYSDNASFLYWLPDSLHIDNIVLITDDHEEMQHDFLKDFSSVKLYDSITNIYARERGSLIIVLKGANEKMNQMFQKKIEADREKFK